MPLNLDIKVTLGTFLFGAVKWTKNPDSDKYSCSRYVIVFDARGFFSVSSGDGFGKNVKIYRVDNSSSVHAGKRKKGVLRSNGRITWYSNN